MIGWERDLCAEIAQHYCISVADAVLMYRTGTLELFVQACTRLGYRGLT